MGLVHNRSYERGERVIPLALIAAGTGQLNFRYPCQSLADLSFVSHKGIPLCTSSDAIR